MKNIPEKIYLNINIDGYATEYDDFKELNEHEPVTWSEKRLLKDDVEYVRKK